jgi:hypothetical protein
MLREVLVASPTVLQRTELKVGLINVSTVTMCITQSQLHRATRAWLVLFDLGVTGDTTGNAKLHDMT